MVSSLNSEAVQLTITNLVNSVTSHHKLPEQCNLPSQTCNFLNLNKEELTIKVGNFFKFVKRNLPKVRVTSLIWK